MSIKLRFSKKCIGFIVIFPLLIVTSLVNVVCPVCLGTCSVSSAPGMENVKIIDVNSEWQLISELRLMAEFGMTMADMFEAIGRVMFTYYYDVEITVVNDSPDDAEGYVKLVLLDLSKGDEFAPGSVMDAQYVTLEIPGETSLDVTYGILFLSEEDVWRGRTEVYAEVAIEYVPDVTCNETGKVPLNNWLLVNGFKDSFLELGKEGVHYEPAMLFGSGDEQ